MLIMERKMTAECDMHYFCSTHHQIGLDRVRDDTFFVIYDHSRSSCQTVIYDHSRSYFENLMIGDHNHDRRYFFRSL